MKELLDLVVFDNVFAWTLFAVTFVGIAVIPKLFGVNLLNGLVLAQIMLLFNALPIIAGLSTDAISIERGIHFFGVEFVFLTVMYAIYSRLLRKRVQIFAALNRFFDSSAAKMLVGMMVLIAVFDFIVVPTDGSSRITYMTASWFSFVSPFIQLATSMAYFGVFLLLQNTRRRRLGYVLLMVAIIDSILTGSKASFAFGLLIAFLALRDLSPDRMRIRYGDKLKLFVLVGTMVVLALTRLNVSFADVGDRFFLYGEATILTYFSDKPTTACENVSTFASMHRGLARLAGDPSANDIDTLFGYALMIQATGVNTFTGPNARLSAYTLCNFPGERIVLCAIVVVVYLVLLLAVFRRALARPMYLAVVYPFLLGSISSAAQDFNLIMQGITVFILLLIATIFLYAKPSHQPG